ncbi:hypothetical protein ACLK19_29135 [Escherichia coli]
MALVKAPGEKMQSRQNQTACTDGGAMPCLPYTIEYREQRVALDTNTLAITSI